MENEILALPEISGLNTRRHVIRIPPELDVPLTDRVRSLIDTQPFRRLASITQLGLVAHVYPAAHHRRFEHSLGVYRLALHYLKRLASEDRFLSLIDGRRAELFLVAALLHDIGHWPFCHLLEDMQLPDVPRHEMLARQYLTDSELSDVLSKQWSMTGAEVADLLETVSSEPEERLLQSMLSGPIDVDKMDYLHRDSLHAGVPYGRNFDQSRLISSLCINRAGDGLAITDKGKTAAEMMVFARYVMFSEVYWHHAVRSATAMLQRAFHELRDRLDVDALFHYCEEPFIRTLTAQSRDSLACDLIDGLFGPRRGLYKRLAQYTFHEHPEIYGHVARRPYDWLVRRSHRLADLFSGLWGCLVRPTDVLIDAPPAKLEVQFNVDVYDTKRAVYRKLGELSPVVQTLAKTQFDDYVKRVRIFVHPRLIDTAMAKTKGDTLDCVVAEATADGK